MFYKQKEIIYERRFITGDISETHELLKNDCKIINEFLSHYYAIWKNYKYYNSNLIENQEFIKNDQKNHCDFPTSVKTFSSSGKNNTHKTPTNKNIAYSK